MDFTKSSLISLSKIVEINISVMAHSSHTRSNVSIGLFNLPLLPDERTMTMNNDLPHDFYLPDGNNSKIG